MKAVYSISAATIITLIGISAMTQNKPAEAKDEYGFDSVSAAIRRANDSILRLNKQKSAQVVTQVQELDSTNKVMKIELKETKMELRETTQELRDTQAELEVTMEELQDKNAQLQAKPREIVVTKIVERRKNFWGREKVDTVDTEIDTIEIKN